MIIQQFGGAEVLNARDLTFNPQLGPRVSLVREGALWDIELTHFNVTGWTASGSVTAPPNLVWPATVLPNDGVVLFDGVMRFTSHSKLFSTEANLYRAWGERLRLLGGVRWIEFHDALIGEDLFPSSNYVFTDNTTDNHLYGGQLGIDLALLDLPRLRVNTTFKAGVLANVADSTTERSDGFFQLFAGDTRAAFLGEVLVVGSWQLSPTWSLRAGGQFLWLSGIALSPEQIDNTVAVGPPDTTIDLSGQLFSAGALAGLEARF